MELSTTVMTRACAYCRAPLDVASRYGLCAYHSRWERAREAALRGEYSNTTPRPTGVVIQRSWPGP